MSTVPTTAVAPAGKYLDVTVRTEEKLTSFVGVSFEITDASISIKRGALQNGEPDIVTVKGELVNVLEIDRPAQWPIRQLLEFELAFRKEWCPKYRYPSYHDSYTGEPLDTLLGWQTSTLTDPERIRFPTKKLRLKVNPRLFFIRCFRSVGGGNRYSCLEVVRALYENHASEAVASLALESKDTYAYLCGVAARDVLPPAKERRKAHYYPPSRKDLEAAPLARQILVETAKLKVTRGIAAQKAANAAKTA